MKDLITELLYPNGVEERSAVETPVAIIDGEIDNRNMPKFYANIAHGYANVNVLEEEGGAVKVTSWSPTWLTQTDIARIIEPKLMEKLEWVLTKANICQIMNRMTVKLSRS